MRRVINGKSWMLACLLIWVIVVRMLTGCGMSKDDENKVRDLDFTVTGEADVPQELQKIIGEKKTSAFKLTYSDDQNLYIVVGYGEQPTGGYSIAVNELYLTKNSIVINTELKGPETGEKPGEEKSYSYIVIKTEFLEHPVVFQ